jgi:hypothetical protein
MQHDLVVDNNDGFDVRIDINQALQALGSMMLGTVPPAPTYPCELWADNSTGKIWIRNSANTVWLQFGRLDVPEVGGLPAGGAAGQVLVKASAVDGDASWGQGGLPSTGGTLSGDLTITGNLQVNGVTNTYNTLSVNLSDGLLINVPAGQWGRLITRGAREWRTGVDPSGNWSVTDQSAGATRFLVDANGNVTFYQGIWVSGGVNVTGAVVSNAGDAGFQLYAAQGGYARYLAQVNNVRQWRWGCEASGNFAIADISAGGDRFIIDTNGNATHYGSVTSSVQNGFSLYAPNGQQAFYLATVAGVREWGMGCQTDGSFYIYDFSSGILPFSVGPGNGIITHNYPLHQAGQGINYVSYANVNVAFRWIALTNFALFINGSNVGTVYMQASDERLKKNVKGAEGDSLAELKKLRLYSFDLPNPVDAKRPVEHVSVGFSAQQIEKIIPEAVTKSPARENDPDRDYEAKPWQDDEMQLSLNTSPIVARCVAAIQQLSAKIEVLEAKLAANPT